jgi:hypothetical protein
MAGTSTNNAQTPDISNGFRVIRVVQGPLTHQYRDLLRQHIPPATLTGKVQQEQKKKKSFLNKLSADQLLILCPSSRVYTGNYDDFDISLIYTLLRNISGISPHSKGWGKEPDPNDRSLAANIERVRSLRNEISHKCISFSEKEFQGRWSAMKQIVKELDTQLSSNGKYEKILDNLEHSPLDPKEIEFWRKNLKKRKMEEDVCKRDIKKMKRK